MNFMFCQIMFNISIPIETKVMETVYQPSWSSNQNIKVMKARTGVWFTIVLHAYYVLALAKNVSGWRGKSK